MFETITTRLVDNLNYCDLYKKKEIDDKYKAEMADLTRTYNVYIDKMRRLVDIQDAGVDFTSEIKDGSVNDRHEEPAT